MENREKGSIIVWTLVSIGGLIALVTLVPLLLSLLGIINLPFHKLQSKVSLNQGVITKTYNTDYCLQNYHWFKETDQAIQQADSQIGNIQSQVSDFKQTYGSDTSKWNFAATQQYGQITTSLTGLQNYRADLVGQYNAKTQELDRVACKDLPLFIQP